MKNEEELKKLFNNFVQCRREFESATNMLEQAKSALKNQEKVLTGTTEKYFVAKQALDEALQEESAKQLVKDTASAPS